MMMDEFRKERLVQLNIVDHFDADMFAEYLGDRMAFYC